MSHADAAAAFAAIATPVTPAGVQEAQLAAMALFEARGSYGCEHHLFVQTMRRVSACLWVAS